MGRPRIKIIDDSAPQEEKRKDSGPFDRTQGEQARMTKPVKKQEDNLVAKLQEELGIPEKREQKTAKTEKPAKPSKTKPRSKKYQEVSKELDRSKTYPLPQALDIVKNKSYTKFNGTLEAHIKTTQTGLRGFLQLPYAQGKKIRILAFPSTTLGTSGKGVPEIEGVVFGDDSTLAEIEKGKIDFDILITTPEWMPKLAKVAKILGPRSLMPNPKNGTITDDLAKAVESFRAGKTEYKTEAKNPVMHLGLGKLDQPTEQLEANVKTLLRTLGKSRIAKVTLSPTMGPSVKVDLNSI